MQDNTDSHEMKAEKLGISTNIPKYLYQTEESN